MNKEIDEKTIPCPKNKVYLRAMMSWGKKKRQRYAQLITIEKLFPQEAFEVVENDKGIYNGN